MPTIASLTSFTANTQAKAAEVNANFSSIRTTVNTYAAFQDASATITGAWTFSTAPVFTNAQAFAAAVTVAAGGLTVTAGGLTVTAGASTFGAGVGITGTCTATTFSGSGASLTDLPAANITGTLPAISGVNLTALNGSNIASGTVAEARLPTSYTALAVTTLTSSTVQGSTGGGKVILQLETASSYFATFSSGAMITASAPAGGVNQYLNVRIGVTDYRITCVPV
jgi:uncharacterized protein GlcG (DUF336 family)